MILNCKILSALFLVFIISSCNKNEIGPQCESNPIHISEIENSGFLVINEGNFNFGNSSLSLFNQEDDLMSNAVFESINGIPLGDTFQSMTRINDQYYFVINNSGKIVITDTLFQYIDDIENLNSPRFILQVDEFKAYVSDFFANEISIINLNDNSVTTTISISGWSENIIKVDERVFVQDNTNNKLLVVNSETDEVQAEIQLTAGISGMVLTNDNTIWVLCNGGFLNESNPILYQINTDDYSIIQSFDFGADVFQPSYLTYNVEENCLYYSQDGIMKMNCSDISLPSELFIENQFANVYGLDFHNTMNELIITDANDFVSQGLLYRFDTSGSLIDQYVVGVNPNGIFALN